MDLSCYGKIKYPLVFLSNLKILMENQQNSDKEKITDEKAFYLVKYFLRFYHFKIKECDISQLFVNFNKIFPKTTNLIASHQRVISILIKDFENIKSYHDKVGDKFIDKKIDDQILFWQNKLDILHAINETTFGEGYMIRLINMPHKNEHYQKETINRLIQIKKLLGLKFFIKNKIELFTIKDFENFSHIIQAKIYLHLFIKIKNIIQTDINKLQSLNSSLKLFRYLYN